MARVRSLLVLVMALALGAVLVATAQAEAPRGSRRGAGARAGRGSLLGLLRLEQVQKDLKLTGEQMTKVTKLSEELGAEMRKEFSSLREIDDREKRRAKMTGLTKEFDSKARGQLCDVLNKEQMTRLDQIRMQARPVVQNLADKDVAGQLKLTQEQKKELAKIGKDMRTKQSELYGTMRGASREQRTEASQKLRKIRSDADKEALELLTADQKQAFEKMQGKKIELQRRRGRR